VGRSGRLLDWSKSPDVCHGGGDDQRDFLNGTLFPYLHVFEEKASGPNTLKNEIGEIFEEIKNKMQSSYNPREIMDHIDELGSPRPAAPSRILHVAHLDVNSSRVPALVRAMIDPTGEKASNLSAIWRSHWGRWPL
jgi:hypothetical protein